MDERLDLWEAAIGLVTLIMLFECQKLIQSCSSAVLLTAMAYKILAPKN